MDISKVFDKVDKQEIGFLYIINKVAQMPRKKDRLAAVKNLMDYMQNGQDKTKETKIYNINCPSCWSDIDQDTGLCLNCDS